MASAAAADRGEVVSPEIPEQILLSVWIIHERPGEWTALATEFDLAAKAATRDLAVDQLLEIVDDYVRSAVNDGLTLREAIRPVPRRARVRLHALSALTRLRGRERRRAQETSLPMRAPRVGAC